MCYCPVRALTNPDGGRPIFNRDGDLLLPCGKCAECIKLRACDFALRVQWELGDYDDNCFLTLTYDDAHYPESLLDRKVEFQKFIKRLRRRLSQKIKYIVSHEFGSDSARIHHHAIIFGFNPSDLVFLKKSPKGHDLFTSDFLDRVWKQGFHSVGTATPGSAYYIASYALKSHTIDVIDDSGEIISLSDCMNGSHNIGMNYFLRNYKDIVARNERVPRYFHKKIDEYLSRDLDSFEIPDLDKVVLYRDIQDELEILKSNQNYEPRSQYQKYAKSQIDKAALQFNSEFRRKDVSKTEAEMLRYYKEETMSFLHLLKSSDCSD